jgi:hypothetical protein
MSGQVMHDPVDIRRRIDGLVARIDRRDDYGQLLASGQVIHPLEDVEDVQAWRVEIRRQARADKIKVRTNPHARQGVPPCRRPQPFGEQPDRPRGLRD